MLKWPKLWVAAEMEFVWNNIYCKPSRSETLKTLADKELLTCNDTVLRFTLKHAAHIFIQLNSSFCDLEITLSHRTISVLFCLIVQPYN